MHINIDFSIDLLKQFRKNKVGEYLRCKRLYCNSSSPLMGEGRVGVPIIEKKITAYSKNTQKTTH